MLGAIRDGDGEHCCLMNGKSYVDAFHEYFLACPDAGWGLRFFHLGGKGRSRLERIRPGYRFDESCQRTVPAAMIAFLESSDYEDAIRKAFSLGGDADTLACITGAIAEAHYGGVPPHIASRASAALDDRLLGVLTAFRNRYMIGR